MFSGSFVHPKRIPNPQRFQNYPLKLAKNLDVYAYVKGIADLLLSGSRDYESMRAVNWAISHPEHVRQYRTQEARYSAERKLTRRDERHRESLSHEKSSTESDPSI